MFACTITDGDPRPCLFATCFVLLRHVMDIKSFSMVCVPSAPSWVLTDDANTGNVIANRGFINHFGFHNEQGTYVLKAQYTALWGAMQSLGQLVGMVLLNPVSDRIGRKMTMYLLWVILAAVSVPQPTCPPI